jgi:copper transport protein
MRRAGRVVALAALLLAVFAAPAGGHASLESSTPARGAALDAPPRELVLRFTEPVEIALGAVHVRDASGREVQQGAAFHPGGESRAVAVRLPGDLPDGGYTATYRVVSADSHPISGGFVFGVGEGGVASAPSVGALLPDHGAGAVTSTAFAAVRGVQFGAITLAGGALAVLVLVWLPALAALALPDPRWRSASEAFAARWRRILLAAAGAGLLSALLGLPLQAATAEGSTFWAGLGGAGEVLGTRFGTVWGLGALAWLAVLGLAGASKATAPAVRPATVGATGVAVPRSGPWALALALPLLWLVMLPALAGHASVQEPVAVLLPANVLHVLAASAWIGGIAVLLLALPAATRRLDPADRTALLTAAVGRFSTLALISVAALLAGGIAQSLLQLNAPGDLLDTAYGRAILVKSSLVAALLCLGALNRRRTLPALDRAAAAGAPPGRAGAALRGALRAELALGAAALATTGALAGYAPAGTTGPFSDSAALGSARAELTVSPALAGPNEVRLAFFDRADKPWHGAKQLDAQAALPARGIAPIELQPRREGPGVYVVDAARLAPAGDWKLTIAVRVSEFDEARAEFDVPVE